MTNPFLLGDPLKKAPRGTALGAPAADGTVAMIAGGSTLATYGWTANQTGALLPGDYFEINYRLYRVLEQVNTNASGKAVISIYPSLREVPANGDALILTSPKGLFRLATNSNKWSSDYTKLSSISIPFLEYR